jgi:pilus assembly protein CpaF
MSTPAVPTPAANGAAAVPDVVPESDLELKHALHRKLLERINLDRLAEIDAPRVRREVRNALAALVDENEFGLPEGHRNELIDQVLNEVFGLGPLEPLMQDPTVSDILVTTPDLVYVERAGKLIKTQVKFKDNAHLQRIIQKIVSHAGRRIDESSPMVDARLPDGSRVNAVIAPVAVDGPLLSIRRFSKDPLLKEDLVAMKTLTEPMMSLLAACVRARLNVLIAGGTGSGKTTMLNILSSCIPSDERIVTIEDTAELQLRQEHVARMETRLPNLEGEGAIDQRRLLVNSLRMRPDRIILGEVRGEEAMDMLQAMNTGHDGSLATIHANSGQDAVNRLELMVGLANSNISVASIRKHIAAAIQVFVQLERLSDGTRKVTQISESRGLKDGEVEIQELFVFEKLGVAPSGKVEGRFRGLGVKPRFLDRLRRSNQRISEEEFDSVDEV